MTPESTRADDTPGSPTAASGPATTASAPGPTGGGGAAETGAAGAGRRTPAEVAKAAYRHNRQADIWPVLLAAGGVAAALQWMGKSGSKADMVILACTYALIALGMYVPFVMAGSLSMAYSAYAALGGYAVAVISRDTGLPLWVGWIVGAVISAVVAVILSLATRRLSGFFLAAVTLLLGVAFEQWLIAGGDFTGASLGIGNVRPATILGWAPTRPFLVLMALITVMLVAWAVDRLRRSPWGIIVRTTREVPLPVEASGVRVANLTTVALALGAAIASVGGSLFVSFNRGITPETFRESIVFLAIFMPLIGGKGTPWGAIIGAVLVVQLTINTPGLEVGGLLLLALAVLFIMLAAPSGILGLLDGIRQRLMGRRPNKSQEPV